MLLPDCPFPILMSSYFFVISLSKSLSKSVKHKKYQCNVQRMTFYEYKMMYLTKPYPEVWVFHGHEIIDSGVYTFKPTCHSDIFSMDRELFG
ncbi:hypothetical protein FOCC_FOCC009276 [Frankliniella occidentalis]|nr:hypothetical protein FOCC_FOCC009276 [Frankliniella occidentalis]